MRVIFLDIDGVLNSYQSTIYWERNSYGKSQVYKLCPIAISNLSHLLGQIKDLHIVISSTWRLHHDLDWIKQHLLDSGCVFEDRVIGQTPELPRHPRGDEIHAFLNKWKRDGFDHIQDFVILDDDQDMTEYMDKLVKCDNRIGLSWIEVQKVFQKFGIHDPTYCGF